MDFRYSESLSKRLVKSTWKALYMSYFAMTMSAIMTGVSITRGEADIAAIGGAMYGCLSGTTLMNSLLIEPEMRECESKIRSYEIHVSDDI